MNSEQHLGPPSIWTRHPEQRISGGWVTVSTSAGPPFTRSPVFELFPDRLPILGQVLGRSPGERLRCKRRVVRTTGYHHCCPEYPEIRRLVRETPAIDHVGL